MTDITIPGYTIIRKLGQGGMATVYLAVQHGLEREVALKVMSPLLNSDPTFAARFKREARIVAQLRHASIVPVFEVGEHQSSHYLSMEYLSGGDLKRRLLEGDCDLNLVLNVCTSLSAALDTAHRKGFVHRDIKPENILFREDGTPVLTDFGIARALDSGRSMTVAGMLVGTPHYMSPEQVKGLELDGRSDLYSLGIVFYEMLAGAVPFKADSTLSVALKQVSEALPALPSEYAAYQEFLDCLTAKDRDDRFASGAEVVRALRVIGTARGARSQTLVRSPTTPGTVRTATGMLQPEALQSETLAVSAAAPAADTPASQPTLAWPRAAATPAPTLTQTPTATVPAPDLSATTIRPAPTTPTQMTTRSREAEVSPRPADPARSAVSRQTLWIAAALLVVVLVGVAFIFGGRRAPQASQEARQSVVAPAEAQQAAQTSPPVLASATAPASTPVTPTSVPTSAPTPAAPAASPSEEAHASNTAIPEAPTPGSNPVQVGDSATPATVPAETGQAKTDTKNDRKHAAALLRQQQKQQKKAAEEQMVADLEKALRDAQLQKQEKRVQELLTKANREYADGALYKPADANAADDYREVLRIQPERPEALVGARRVADILAAEAAQNEAIGEIYNSKMLIEQVKTLQKDHPKLPDLEAKLAQMNGASALDPRDRARLDKAAKFMGKTEAALARNPLDYHAVDDATDEYDRAVSAAPMAPGLPSLRERLIGAYATAIQTEIDNHDLKRARKLINSARKHKWISEDLERLDAKLQAGDAPPTAAVKESGAGDPAK